MNSLKVDSRLVSFLYSLTRDHLPVGVVERLVNESLVDDVEYTNEHLARYCADVAKRLGDDPKIK